MPWPVVVGQRVRSGPGSLYRFIPHVGKGKAALKAAGAAIDWNWPATSGGGAHPAGRRLTGCATTRTSSTREGARLPDGADHAWGIPAVQAALVSDSAAGNARTASSIPGYRPAMRICPGLTSRVRPAPPGTRQLLSRQPRAGTIAAVDQRASAWSACSGRQRQTCTSSGVRRRQLRLSYSSTLVAALGECRAAGATWSA